VCKVHVLLKKEELDAQRLADKVVVVLDVLFATTSIVYRAGPWRPGGGPDPRPRTLP